MSEIRTVTDDRSKTLITLHLASGSGAKIESPVIVRLAANVKVSHSVTTEKPVQSSLMMQPCVIVFLTMHSPLMIMDALR